MKLLCSVLKKFFFLSFLCLSIQFLSACGSMSGGYSSRDEINKIFESYQKEADIRVNDADKSYNEQASSVVEQRQKEDIKGDKAFVLSEGLSDKETDISYFKFLEMQELNGTVYLVYAYQAKKSGKDRYVSEVVKYDLNSFNFIKLYSKEHSVDEAFRFAANVSHLDGGKITNKHIYDVIDNFVVYKIDDKGSILGKIDMTEKLLLACDKYNRSSEKIKLDYFTVSNFALDDSGNVFMHLVVRADKKQVIIDVNTYDPDAPENQVVIVDDGDDEDEDISEEEAEEKYKDEIAPSGGGYQSNEVLEDLLVSYYTVTKTEISLYCESGERSSRSSRDKKDKLYSYSFGNDNHDKLENLAVDSSSGSYYDDNNGYDDSSIINEYQDVMLSDMKNGKYSFFVTDDEPQWDDNYKTFAEVGNNVLITIAKSSSEIFVGNTFGCGIIKTSDAYNDIELKFKNSDFKPNKYTEDDNDFYENNMSFHTKSLKNVKNTSSVGVSVNSDDTYEFVEIKEDNTLNIKKIAYGTDSLELSCSINLQNLYNIPGASAYKENLLNSKFTDFSKDNFDSINEYIDIDADEISSSIDMDVAGVTFLSDNSLLISSLDIGTLLYDPIKKYIYQVSSYPCYKSYKLKDNKFLFLGYKVNNLTRRPDFVYSNFFILEINDGQIYSQTLDRYVRSNSAFILYTLSQFDIQNFAKNVGISDFTSYSIKSYFEDLNYEIGRFKESVRTLYNYINVKNEDLYNELLVKFSVSDIVQASQLETEFVKIYERVRPQVLDGLGVNAKISEKRLKIKENVIDEFDLDSKTYEDTFNTIKSRLEYVLNMLTDE